MKPIENNINKNCSAITSASGRAFDFLDISNQSISIEDIAHALSHICRFTGHSKEFYSVAQHSVLVSYSVPEEYALQGLLHDAAESVLGDVSTPLKQLLPDYNALEQQIEKAIFSQFNIPETLHPCVKEADLRLLMTEVRDLTCQTESSLKFYAQYAHIKPLSQTITPMWPEFARQRFLERFHELTINE